MALHGAGPIAVGDIDLLMSRADAGAVLSGCGVAPRPGSASERFRSDVFGAVALGGFMVEVFGGFYVHDGLGWREVVPVSRVAVRIGAHVLFVPSVAELIGMCRMFARPKDAERERLLRGLA